MIKEDGYEKIIKMMAVLAEPMRMKILMEVSANNELRAKDILEKFSVTQPTMSHHLNILTEAGLLELRKEGRCIWYSINESNMSQIKEIILAISDHKAISAETSVKARKPVVKKVATRTSKSSVETQVKVSGLKKKSSVPKPKQVIEVPDIEELKKNKKKKKDKDKNKSDKKKKDKKKKK